MAQRIPPDRTDRLLRSRPKLLLARGATIWPILSSARLTSWLFITGRWIVLRSRRFMALDRLANVRRPLRRISQRNRVTKLHLRGGAQVSRLLPPVRRRYAINGSLTGRIFRAQLRRR